MIKNLILLLILCVNIHTFAQHNTNAVYEITGTVTSNGESIPFATVSIKNTSTGTVCDEYGVYNFKSKHGDVIVSAQAVGYKTVEKNIHLDNNTTLKFELPEDVFGLDQVVVSATKTSLNRREAPVLVTVTGAKELQQIQATSLIDGLTFQPGLRTENNCQNCGFSQIRINGLGGAYSQILVNSRPIFSSLNSIYGLEQLPANMIKQIEVTRGGGSAIFGANAIAGTINIITKDPIKNEYQIASKLGWINGKVPDAVITFNNTNVSSDLNKGITVFGMYRNRKEFDANGDGFTEMTKINQLNFGLKSFYRFNDRKKLTAELTAINAFRRGGDQVDEPIALVQIAEEIKSNVIGGGLTYDYYTHNDKNKISIYANSQSTQSNNYYGGGEPEGHGITEDFTFLTGLQHTSKFNKFIKGSMTMTSGVEINTNNINEDRKNPNINDLNQNSKTVGVFTQADWKIHEKLKFLAGVRGEFFDSNLQKSIVVVNPRANILYNFTNNWSFRAGYSQGYRAPQFYSEDLHAELITGEVRRVFLSEDLKEERSESFSGSLEYSHQHEGHQFVATLEGFYTQINNPFVYEDRGTDANDLAFKEKINGDRALVNGMNLELKYSPNPKFTFQIGGTAQNSQYAKYLEQEDNIASNKIFRTPNIYGNGIINYTPNNKWDFNLTGVYTGKMFVPHLFEDANDNILVNTPSMFEFGLNTSRTFNLDNTHQLQLSAGVKNMFNEYQNDFDTGVARDAGYVYGAMQPRTFTIGLKFGTNL